MNSPNEYIYSVVPPTYKTVSISNWLLTPILNVKNGDKISFYTRGDTTDKFTERMQVYMDTLATINVGNDLNSTGDFNVALFDINSGNVAGAYPLTWTKLEYTFKGITDQKNIRIGFRHL